MIARLKGTTDAILTNGIILDVNGVGYEVSMPANVLSTVTIGEALTVEIITVVREDAFMLYGFLSHADKQWFEILTSVQGVGAKVALAIQSVLSSDALYMAVMAADNTAFARANGVGPKLANRIVLELKDRVAKLSADMAQLQSTPTDTPPINANTKSSKSSTKKSKTSADTAIHSIVADTVSALTNLGFGRSEAYTAVQNSLKTVDSADMTTEKLIALTLGQLQS